MIASRSPVARVGIKAASPLAVVAGLYLFFAGHNQPGGGFAAGLVFGAVIALRTVAGLQRPAHAVAILSAGTATVCATAVLPMLTGNTLLDQQVISFTLPLLGKIKTGTALVFDLGVTAIVVGLIIALLDGLGATDLAGGSPQTASTNHDNDPASKNPETVVSS